MPALLSAANRLRNKVLEIPGTVLIVNPGYVDKVIRFRNLPEILVEFKKNSRNNETEKHITIDLGTGPASEAWRNAMDVVRRTARRDVPIPDPIEVATDSHEDWSVVEEDVPVIETIIETVAVAAPKPPEPQAQVVAENPIKKRGRPKKEVVEA